MNFTNRSDVDALSHDGFTARPVSPWPTALWVTTTVLALTLVVCFVFPNG